MAVAHIYESEPDGKATKVKCLATEVSIMYNLQRADHAVRRKKVGLEHETGGWTKFSEDLIKSM